MASRLPAARAATGRRWSPSWPAALAALVLLVAMPAAVMAWDSSAFSAQDESLMVSLTNQRRAAAGLPALAVDSALTSEARSRSKRMGDSHTFSHLIPPDGHTVFDELNAMGYCYKVAAENFAWNTYPDSEATRVAQQTFESSSTHLKNILGQGYTRIGVGAYKAADGTHVWTVLFTQPCGTSATKAPAITPAQTVRRTTTPTSRPTPTAAPTPNPVPAPSAVPAPTAPPEVGVLGEVDGDPSTPGLGARLPATPDPASAALAPWSGLFLEALLALVQSLVRLLVWLAV